MKTQNIFTSIIFSIISFIALGQNNSTDVLYLKSGSVVRGQIIEQIPFQTIKIQTSDGSIFVYKTIECDSIRKEISQGNKERYDRRNTIPIKFSKKCYYASILEMNSYFGQSKYENYFYIKSNKLIVFTGLHTINGVQFLKKYFIGIGTGINIHLADEYIEPYYKLSLPLFLDLRAYFFHKKTQPFINMSAGVVLPLSYITGDISRIDGQANRYYSFINPSLGVKAILTPRNSINISLGYVVLFNKATLVTDMGEGFDQRYLPYFYKYPNYSFMLHEVNNQVNGLNLKIGFSF